MQSVAQARTGAREIRNSTPIHTLQPTLKVEGLVFVSELPADATAGSVLILPSWKPRPSEVCQRT